MKKFVKRKSIKAIQNTINHHLTSIIMLVFFRLLFFYQSTSVKIRWWLDWKQRRSSEFTTPETFNFVWAILEMENFSDLVVFENQPTWLRTKSFSLYYRYLKFLSCGKKTISNCSTILHWKCSLVCCNNGRFSWPFCSKTIIIHHNELLFL
jgi:hypothetical protein